MESKIITRQTLAWLMVISGAVSAGEDVAMTVVNQQYVDQSRYLEAAAAAQRGDYVVAYCFWRPLAEKGDAEAQYALGWMYHNGYGLVSNDRAAKGWWEKAVAQGHVDAMFSLGSLYSVGSANVPRDYGTAMHLWVQAAAAGNENARLALRELALRNLPELAALTRSLQEQYPELLGIPAARKNIKSRFKKGTRENVAVAAEPAIQNPYRGYLRGGEWIAVAAGYRPEYGWAATQLFREGGQLFAVLQK